MTLRALIALAGLLPSLGMAAPVLTAENWNAGLDTNQPGWYFQHPVWKDMKAKFQHKSDSIETVLRGQIPSKVDSIWTKDTAREFSKGQSYRWKTRAIKTEIWGDSRVTVLRPLLLQARPKSDAKPVGLVEPGSGPWRIVREFTYDDVCLLCGHGDEPPDIGSRQDSIDAIREPEKPWRHPWIYVLLADSAGKPLGWAPWDSIAYFKDPASAAQALPFYRDGLADLLDGIWLQTKTVSFVLHSGMSISKSNPETYGGILLLYRINMRRMTYQFSSISGLEFDAPLSMMIDEDPQLARQFYSETKDLKTGKKIQYYDPKKCPFVKTFPLHWFCDEIRVAAFPPLTAIPGMAGEVHMTSYTIEGQRLLELRPPFSAISRVFLPLPWDGNHTFTFYQMSHRNDLVLIP